MSNSGHSLIWIKIPRMEISNTPPHKIARCFEDGIVKLNELVVDFPIGWTTDVTSTPRMLFWLLPQLGGHNSAALLHDRLLDIGFSRKIALFWLTAQLDLLVALGEVSKFRRFIMVTGVSFYDMILPAKKFLFEICK